jgi:hypothetical protein
MAQEMMEVSDDLIADLVSGPQSLLLLVFVWQGYYLLLALLTMVLVDLIEASARVQLDGI